MRRLGSQAHTVCLFVNITQTGSTLFCLAWMYCCCVYMWIPTNKKSGTNMCACVYLPQHYEEYGIVDTSNFGVPIKALKLIKYVHEDKINKQETTTKTIILTLRVMSAAVTGSLQVEPRLNTHPCDVWYSRYTWVIPAGVADTIGRSKLHHIRPKVNHDTPKNKWLSHMSSKQSQSQLHE
jgi:hypothetical protein